MKEDVQDILAETFIHTSKSPTHNKLKRAKVYKALVEKSGLSVRAFARMHDIPKSTLEDWMLWAKLEETDLDKLKESGMTETQVYRGLRGSKGETEVHELDLKIEALINDLNSSQIEHKASKVTYEKLDLLKKAVERAKFRLEKKNG